MHLRRHEEPILITSARQSRSDDISARERRYALTMSTRIIAFILSVSVLRGGWQWAGMAASLVLPWVAVIAANAVQAKPRKHEDRHEFHETGQLVRPGQRDIRQG